ncbi:hypothetical protein [Bacillus sp. KH172YL63]|uniref:hypothetical protein n=1 Tax=Bacillus sp. KH172YL63 TaxID=2709784 RepID=UPI0013E46597|nr:hypothetical protein [Bacillus sp. KH172YL63]BCB02668.1 hypothetical protein KH172YL63_08010 [Bacillus sp. KH172YL63]
MKQVAAAVYLSFGMLFVFLQGFDGYTAPDNMNFIIFLFFMAGILNVYHEVKTHFENKMKEK